MLNIAAHSENAPVKQNKFAKENYPLKLPNDVLKSGS